MSRGFVWERNGTVVSYCRVFAPVAASMNAIQNNYLKSRFISRFVT